MKIGVRILQIELMAEIKQLIVKMKERNVEVEKEVSVLIRNMDIAIQRMITIGVKKKV